MSISPVLSASQLAFLAQHGEERTAAAGDVLFEIGDERYPFIAILEGEAAILDSAGDEIVRHGASGFLGEMNLMTGQTVYLTAVVTQPMRYIAVEREVLRPLLFEDGPLGDVLLSAFMSRREALQRHQGIGVEIIGPRSSAETRALLDYVRRARLPHTWRDEDEPGELPLVRLPGGTELRRPTGGEVWRALGIGAELARREEVDVVIVGGGPAGLGAAVYAASEGLDALVIESTVLGGQAGVSRRIENYLGFPAGISGGELTDPRRDPGAEVRRALRHALPGGGPRAGRRPARRAARERRGGGGARGRPGHGRGLPPPTGRRPRGLRGHQRLLRRRAARGAALRGDAGRRRGRRQLGRAGRDLAVARRGARDAAAPPRRPARDDVGLPDRRSRAPRRRGARPLRDRGAARERR